MENIFTALQLNHDLQINVIDQSNATNSIVTAAATNNKTTTINMNSKRFKC